MAVSERGAGPGGGPAFPVVALVTSAGGLGALSAVLGALPADLPAALLVPSTSTRSAPAC